MPGPLAGTLNAENAPPQADRSGLFLPGYATPPQAPQRDATFADMGRVALSGIGAAMSLPRIMAWNAGPAMVGRSGQGPQTGTELLSRLGMNPDSGLTGALGAGVEMAADPMTLLGSAGMRMASARNAAPATTSIAEQMAARPEQGRIAWSTTRPPPQPAPSPTPAWGGNLPLSSYGQAPGVSPSFLQGPMPAGGYPNFPTPLSTQSFMTPASNGGHAANRLQRFLPQPQRTAAPIDY